MKRLLLVYVFLLVISACATTAPAASPSYSPREVDYSRYIQPPDAQYEIKGLVFVTVEQAGKYDFNTRRVMYTGERITYEKIIREAMIIDGNGVINIVIDTVETKNGDTYTRKQTATGLAIKYISE